MGFNKYTHLTQCSKLQSLYHMYLTISKNKKEPHKALFYLFMYCFNYIFIQGMDRELLLEFTLSMYIPLGKSLT